MKTLVFSIVFFLFLRPDARAVINFDTLTPNSWAQVSTLYQYPGTGGETHLAWDTSGYANMVGSCAFGGSAGGTHNNDIFRFNNRTGMTEKMLTCGTNPWPGGCQGGQVFDSKRNCLWFGPGANAVCRTGVLYFPGLAYYGGLYRMNCPTTPIQPTPPPVTVEKIRDEALGGNYYVYDPGNDLIIGVKDNSYSGCRLSIYNIQSNTVTSSVAPFTNTTSGWRVPCCFDTKRGLLVIARWGDMDAIWFYNPSTGQWSSKTPPTIPTVKDVPLVYEPAADRYLLIGTYPENSGDEHPQVWVYDYGNNDWSQVPRGTRHYDTVNPASSTWPPLRVYPGSFGYDAKNKVIMNWGGLNTSMTGGDSKIKQSIWIFKSTGGGSGVSRGRALPAQPLFTASPNPFSRSTRISFPGRAALEIYDLSGKRIERLEQFKGEITWTPPHSAGGVFIVKLNDGKAAYSQKLLFLK